MPGWMALAGHNNLLILVIGLVGALGVIGWGWPIARLAGVAPVLQWPVSWLTGILLLSAITQILAIVAGVNGATMGVVAVLLALSAIVRLAGLVRSGMLRRLPRPNGAAETILVAVIVVLALLHLMVAVTPATRSDEIAYHVLVPARIWAEGGLVFHPLPYEATVWPQFSWHVAQTVFHALGVSDASAVLAVTGTLILAALGAAMVRAAGASRALALATAVALLASGYSIVFLTTLGPHAFQYLATTVAVLAALYGDRLSSSSRPLGYALTIGVAAAAMIGAKLPMVPVAALIALAGLYWVWRGGATRGRIVGAALLIAALSTVVIGPLALWATWVSGSPGGVTTLSRSADLAHYDAETRAVYRAALQLFVEDNSFKPRYEATYWNAIVVLGTLLYIPLERSTTRRVIGGGLLLVQVLLIVFVLPIEIRHLGGLQYALTVAAVIAGWERWRERGDRPVMGWARHHPDAAVATGALLLVMPWAAVLVWVSLVFLPPAIGLRSAPAHVARYSPLTQDFALLDSRLPRDAVLLVGHQRSGDAKTLGWLSRPPMFYAPRPAAFHSADLPANGRPYLFLLREQGATGMPAPADLWLPAGWRVDRPVLHNPAACFYPQRVPGGGCGLADLLVLSLKR